jgi:hypothetical protein
LHPALGRLSADSAGLVDNCHSKVWNVKSEWTKKERDAKTVSEIKTGILDDARSIYDNSL